MTNPSATQTTPPNDDQPDMPGWAIAMQNSIIDKLNGDLIDKLNAQLAVVRGDITSLYNLHLSAATSRAYQVEVNQLRIVNFSSTHPSHPLEPMPAPPVPPQVDIPAPGVAITAPPSGIPPPGPPPPGFPSTVREARELSYDELGALLAAFGLSSDGDAAERATRFALFVGYPA